MEPLLVGVGGSLGAMCRYLLGAFLGERSFPWATLTVNVVGSFILGVVLFGVTRSDLLLLVGVGFCGAFTTFSSFGFETVTLWWQGKHRKAVLNALANLVVSLLAFGCAWLLVG